MQDPQLLERSVICPLPALYRGVHTVGNGAVICLLKETIVCERVGDSGVRWLDQCVFGDIVEALEDVKSWSRAGKQGGRGVLDQ